MPVRHNTHAIESVYNTPYNQYHPDLDNQYSYFRFCSLWVGGVFARSFAYADDITILAPSVQSLNIMVDICNTYANQYDAKILCYFAGPLTKRDPAR